MDIKLIIVKVILPLPIRQYFNYLMPNHLMHPIIGGRILVPFNSKEIVGIVIAYSSNKVNIHKYNLRYVKCLIDNESLYTDIVLDILKWISDNYHCPIGNLFFSVLPVFLRSRYIIKNKYIREWSITKKGLELDLTVLNKRKKQLYALILLKKNSILNTELDKYNLSIFILNKLKEQGLCQSYINNKLLIKKKYLLKIRRKYFLNKTILTIINTILIKKHFSSWLLTKINLYSKVKFYLGLIEAVLYKGMQILIVVPSVKQINLIKFFLEKYFNISIDIIHTKLSKIKYLKNWIRIKKGEISILIGTKKSVFFPFMRLGIIIILEEHHLNYKSINHCRYSFRDIAILRASKENIPIILDSDTPSLKTLHNVLSNKCCQIELNQVHYLTRLNNVIINLNKEKIKFGLSLTLINDIKKSFRNKQVLLIFNKFNLCFFFLKCNTCCQVFKCINCNEYFEINKYNDVIFCKFCLIKIKKPIFCNICGSFNLTIFSTSLEQMKYSIEKIFPHAPLFFLLNNKNIDKKMFNEKNFEFSLSIPYIIITTEEIVQNYFFPNVKLISLISIDHYFLSFKFHSIEYFAQFYINLNKLVKNKKKRCKFLIQTSFPNDSNLKELFNSEYFSFSNEILKIRKNFLLPPFSFQSIIYTKSIYADNNIIFLNLIYKILKKNFNQNNCLFWFVGPHRSFKFKNKKKCFHQLLIQYSSRFYFHNLFNQSIDIINNFSISKRVEWFIDVEPN